jgi:uncharacterized protein
MNLITAIISLITGLFSPQVAQVQNIAQIIAPPTPTPVPFVEMTIPHLRARQYTSSLGELRQISRNSSYVSYRTSYDSDGLKINGLLTVPTGTEPAGGWPAVIFIHGYIPPSIYKTETNYVSYVDSMAKNGLVVFKIDLRGHDQSEGEASGAYYSQDYIIDVLNARSALQKYSVVNPNQIGLWGHSMAGNVVARTLAVQPDIPAAVIWAGAVYTYSDLTKYGIDDNSYRPPADNTNRQRKREQLFAAHGQFNPDSPFWKQIVATRYLSDFKTAIQFHHAQDDTVVNIGYSRDFNQLLNSTSVVHELHEYQSGGHNLTGGSYTTAMNRTVDFFKTYLSK